MYTYVFRNNSEIANAVLALKSSLTTVDATAESTGGSYRVLKAGEIAFPGRAQQLVIYQTVCPESMPTNSIVQTEQVVFLCLGNICIYTYTYMYVVATK